MSALHRLLPGQSGIIEGYELEDESVLRLGEMGLIPGQQVKILKVAPLGDPIEIEIMHYRLCLRKREAAKIQVRPLP
ncbi:MAG: ferrous iron transport protein A [Leptonema illini]|uniref:FeoA family protein n=2 Tax=Leptonema illini TaxID=183 RepID=H2CDC4_9LEPT|nr:FeoA family protein [Leptonema illini]EHQ05428.1 FeoA family protein [Leptonema illini DSM 21528]KAB2931947.1 MAG: ferrous iron transport protein A [Leptonema illini]